MAPGVSSALVCLVVKFLSHSQGLQFTLDSTPDTFYCGHLNCSVDVNQNDPRIFSVIGLIISNIVDSKTLIKLASVSVMDLVPHVEPAKVHDLNATGSVSRYHAYLDLSLRDKTDCLLTSFLCEMDFVNVSGQSDKIREVVTPVDTSNCDDVDRKLTAMNDTLTDLKSQNSATEQKLVRLDTKLDNVLGYLARLEAMINSSQHSDNDFSCAKGTPYTESREKFLLWGRVPALCDTETDGGGWVIIQRRTKGDVDFYRGWDDYKKGFGTPDTDYWLGNDNINNITSQGYTNLRVDMEYEGVKYFAEYSNFSMADEISKYKLTASGYHGNAGDSLNYFSGWFFSTFDRDNDAYNGVNCAEYNHGGWWYKLCSDATLNGIWGAQNGTGLNWYDIAWPDSVTSSEMKVRQV